MTQTTNPVLRLMHQKRWRWVSNEDVLRITGCDQAFVDETLLHSAQIGTVEAHDFGSGMEYRYIGSTREPHRVAVEYLRRAYPNTATVRRISYESKIDVPKSLCKFSDILPIEQVKKEYGIAHYRYVPNDRRSLREPLPKPVQKLVQKIKPAKSAPSRKRQTKCSRNTQPMRPRVKDSEQLKIDIMTHLITTREWFTTSELVKSMGVSNVRQVSGLLRDMVRNNYPIETHPIQGKYAVRTMYHYTGVTA